MNRKALQLAISTLIFIVIGIAILIAIILALRGGFERFQGTVNPYLETSEAIAVQDACNLACEVKSTTAFCCTNHEINNEQIACDDPRLQIDCQIDCTNVCP